MPVRPQRRSDAAAIHKEAALSDGSIDIRHEAQARAYAEPLETLNPAQPELFSNDAMWPYFDRLRAEIAGPLHPRQRLRALLVGDPL